MTLGLRHLALRVTNLQRSQTFYERLFSMRVVWQPDADNVYLSSGHDNLALHQIPETDLQNFNPLHHQRLDHFGFLMESPEAVDQKFDQMGVLLHDCGGKVVKPPKRHRDDSYSFYIADPDNNQVQVLYEPTMCQQPATSIISDPERKELT